MKIYKNYSLKKLNTFGFESKVEEFVYMHSTKKLGEVLKNNLLPIQILGGGSNVLFTKDFYDALFIKNNIRGIKIVETTNENVIIEIGGGENWQTFILWAIENNFGGVENLSLIPGTVGAAPIQNIGAYGVELKNVFVKLEAVNLKTFETQIFTAEDCQFGYRDSVFKDNLKGQFLISKVYLRLIKVGHHTLKLEYGDIKRTLETENITSPTIRDVSNAVIKIRQSKLPDPKIIGNAGSFFKNPEIPLTQFENLKMQFPNLVGYPNPNLLGFQNLTGFSKVKIAAGWLIEQAGWKGKRLGNVGVHAQQALVLVNYGKGKSSEIVELSKQIQASVFEKFGIALQTEVNFI